MLIFDASAETVQHLNIIRKNARTFVRILLIEVRDIGS
jgi:hypothetical protein